MKKLLQNKKIDKLLFVSVIVLTALGVSINIIQQQQQDNSKLPSKIEDDIYYQRWVTNLKNKDFEIEAEEFELIEEEQIYNTKWIQLYSVDDEQIMQIFNKTISEFQDTDKVVYSPSERSFIDYRNINKGVQEPQAKNYKPNEVRFFGIRDNKLIEARILECYNSDNCYFDRAFFISNDVFVISEFSLKQTDKDGDNKDKDNNDKGDVNKDIECALNDICDYTIKLHLIDLVNNSKSTYESDIKTINLQETIPEL